MNNLKQIQRMRRLHQLIKAENTGTPKELSRTLNISERQIFMILDQLREMDAPIKYNRRARTYYYNDSFELYINISVQVMQGEKLLHIYAGANFVQFVERLQGRCSRPDYLDLVKSRLEIAG